MNKSYSFARMSSMVAVGVVTMAIAFLVTPTSVRAIESAGIGAVPANPRADNPRTKSIFVFESKPGQTLKDAIKIVNNTNQPKTLRVYPVDSQHSSDGAFACAQEADKRQAVGSWLQLQQSEVTLQPNKNQVIPFTVTLPAQAEPGEYNGCIAVQESKPTSAAQGNGIVLSFRSALRVAVTVPGKIYSNAQFVTIRSEVIGDALHLSPILQNNGNVSVDTELAVGLKNIFGFMAVQKGGEFSLLKQEESRFNFEIERPFWGGWFQKVGSIEYVPLRDKQADKGEKKTAVATPEWIFIAPHPAAVLLYIAALLIIVGGIGYWWWRKRSFALLHQATVAYNIKPGDNLQTLAEKVDVDWRVIAKLNKLKAPYTLTSGQTIYIPHKNHLKKQPKK